MQKKRYVSEKLKGWTSRRASDLYLFSYCITPRTPFSFSLAHTHRDSLSLFLVCNCLGLVSTHAWKSACFSCNPRLDKTSPLSSCISNFYKYIYIKKIPPNLPSMINHVLSPVHTLGGLESGHWEDWSWASDAVVCKNTGFASFTSSRRTRTCVRRLHLRRLTHSHSTTLRVELQTWA